MKGTEPAFPAMDMNSHMGIDRMELRYTGVSKREYFAGLAMQAILTSWSADPSTRDEICKRAVLTADELLKQLES